MAQYYAILTNTGLQKLAAAQANEEPLVLTEFAAGDGSGGYVAPGATWTSLENEVWRGGINRVYQSDTQADVFIVEGFIDRETGGFWVRELGVFDGDGDLIAVAASPETFKAAAEDGAARDLYLRIMLRYANTDAVAFDVEPSQILARHDYVDAQDDQVRQEAEQMVIDHAAKAGGAHGVPEGEAIEWKSAAQQKADAAESAAKGYTDSELSSAASALQSYADSAASDAQQAAQGYADSEIQSHESSRNHPNATTSQPGFMSSGDKSKLNGIEAGAQVNRPTTASRTSTSTTTVLQAAGMNNHRTSGDHDGRYYTQAQVDDMIAGALAIPSGTRMLFQQTSAPTGWTKITSHNNKAIRVVSGTAGSGGSNTFTNAFNSARGTSTAGAHNHGGTNSAGSHSHSHTISVSNHTLATSRIPNHEHYNGLPAGSGSNIGQAAEYGLGPAATHDDIRVTGQSAGGSNLVRGQQVGGGGSHSHGVSGGIQSDGSHSHTIDNDGSHSHTLNLDVQYVDVIIAEKD